MTAVKDTEEHVIVEEDNIKKRQKEYFEELPNVENEREKRPEDVVSGPIMEITMKFEKWKNIEDLQRLQLYHKKLLWVTLLLNNILNDEKLPQEWKKSKLIAIYKKGRPNELQELQGNIAAGGGIKNPSEGDGQRTQRDSTDTRNTVRIST